MWIAATRPVRDGGEALLQLAPGANDNVADSAMGFGETVHVRPRSQNYPMVMIMANGQLIRVEDDLDPDLLPPGSRSGSWPAAAFFAESFRRVTGELRSAG